MTRDNDTKPAGTQRAPRRARGQPAITPYFWCQAHADEYLSVVCRRLSQGWPASGAYLVGGAWPGGRQWIERDCAGIVRAFDRKGGALLVQSQPGQPSKALRWWGGDFYCRA